VILIPNRGSPERGKEDTEKAAVACGGIGINQNGFSCPEKPLRSLAKLTYCKRL
jgi:hypothetical protein